MRAKFGELHSENERFNFQFAKRKALSAFGSALPDSAHDRKICAQVTALDGQKRESSKKLNEVKGNHDFENIVQQEKTKLKEKFGNFKRKSRMQIRERRTP